MCDDGPDALRKLVRQEIGRGVETIKIMASSEHGIPGRTTRNLARDEIASITATAHERGAKVRAHVADKQMMLECIELGVDILDHGDEIDEECIEKMVESGTFRVPSLVYLWESARNRICRTVRRDPCHVRPLAVDASRGAAGWRSNPHWRRLQRRVPQHVD